MSTDKTVFGMIEQFRSGETLREIGARYGISKQRVQQILKAAGIQGKHGGRALKSAERRAASAARLNARYISKYGHDLEAHRRLRDIGRTMHSVGASRERTPIGAFFRQRQNAIERGIDWNLSLAEWWSVWEQSGKWDLRGRGLEGYVMSRFGDVGAYRLGNVFIQTALENNRNAPNRTLKVGLALHGRRADPSLPMGVSLRYNLAGKRSGNIYTAIYRGKYLGVFASAAQAEAAYKMAKEKACNLPRSMV